jgi:hypothetical protein
LVWNPVGVSPGDDDFTIGEDETIEFGQVLLHLIGGLIPGRVHEDQVKTMVGTVEIALDRALDDCSPQPDGRHVVV